MYDRMIVFVSLIVAFTVLALSLYDAYRVRKNHGYYGRHRIPAEAKGQRPNVYHYIGVPV